MGDWQHPLVFAVVAALWPSADWPSWPRVRAKAVRITGWYTCANPRLPWKAKRLTRYRFGLQLQPASPSRCVSKRTGS